MWCMIVNSYELVGHWYNHYGVSTKKGMPGRDWRSWEVLWKWAGNHGKCFGNYCGPRTLRRLYNSRGMTYHESGAVNRIVYGFDEEQCFLLLLFIFLGFIMCYCMPMQMNARTCIINLIVNCNITLILLSSWISWCIHHALSRCMKTSVCNVHHQLSTLDSFLINFFFLVWA